MNFIVGEFYFLPVQLDVRNDIDKVQVNYPAVSAILAGDASPGIIFSSLCQLLSRFEFTYVQKKNLHSDLKVSMADRK